jgi:predicted RNA-binding Zn ribbon-like protein
MVTLRSQDYTFDLSGGRLCLDLANTVSNRGSASPTDHLRTYGDFIAWAVQARAVTVSVARGLLARAEARPADAQRALDVAIDAREMLYRLFAAAAAGKRPRPEDLEVLNDHVPAAFARARLTTAGGRFALNAAAAPDDLASPLAPVVQSAIELLTSSDVQRLRSCAADTCEWLFLDTTKNRTRRWCDMKICGNRAKVRRFRDRGHRRLR